MREAARKSGKLFMTGILSLIFYLSKSPSGFVLRYAPLYVEASKLISSGFTGKLVHIIEFTYSHHWLWPSWISKPMSTFHQLMEAISCATGVDLRIRLDLIFLRSTNSQLHHFSSSCSLELVMISTSWTGLLVLSRHVLQPLEALISSSRIVHFHNILSF